MGIHTTRDLFIYELGILSEMERAGRQNLDFLAHRVSSDDLRQIVRNKQEECSGWEENLQCCAAEMDTSLRAARSDIAQGMYGRFETFVRLDPSPGIIDQFAVDTMIRFLYVTIAAHKSLFDWAVLMHEGKCVQCLHANILQKQESVAEIERYGHELGVRLLAPVGRSA